jgi:MtfA peptidase
MSFVLIYFSAFVVYWTVDYYSGKRQRALSFTRACSPPDVSPTDIVTLGRDLDMEDLELHNMLAKRFHYYQWLNEANKKVFRKRLHRFIQAKTFVIKDEEGFREMPVLVCAAAVQLTFGLKDFTLPFYRYIRIFPEEFISHDFMRILAGNVSHNIISVAWNHLLKGFENALDGSNVGLHEMSHALYFQKIEVEKEYAKNFTRRFHVLMEACKKAAHCEQSGVANLYSAYADKHEQEFWAETVELFFERPQDLQTQYPAVYTTMVQLLRQYPLNKSDPRLRQRLSMPFQRIRLLQKSGSNPSQANVLE